MCPPSPGSSTDDMGSQLPCKVHLFTAGPSSPLSLQLLAQLKGNQEEENRHLLEEIQVLSKENRRLLERSMESREHFQEEQRQYL